MAERDAIVKLFSQYGMAIDAQDWALLDEIFTDDAVWEMAHPGHEPVERRGLHAIKQFLPGSRATGQPRHIFANLRVLREDAESASVTMYMMFTLTNGGMVQVMMTFVYAADVVRTPAGWRFRRISLTANSGLWKGPKRWRTFLLTRGLVKGSARRGRGVSILNTSGLGLSLS
jgi:hypothetical protein